VIPSFFVRCTFQPSVLSANAKAASLLRKKEGQKDRAAAEHPRSCSTDFHSIRLGAPRMARVLAEFSLQAGPAA
jgi:hypothetical protein